VPCHHIYGFLFGVLLPARLRLGEQDFVDVRASTPAWLARAAQPGDVVIGHPEFWAAAARAVQRWPQDVVGVTSTARCPPDVVRAVVDAGLQRLVQVYGSSETAGIATRLDPEDPYELLPFWRFDPANPQWLLRSLPEGGEQAYAPQDVLRRVGERSFDVGSRHDQAVQVGGVNVFPQRVREVLRRHPGVLDAQVRLMHPDEGTRLKAFVVPAPGAPAASELLADLNAWVNRELAAPERPKAIRFGAALPTAANGKPADWGVGTQP
jgi:4-coumarate--CoA ligase (photoactive yellow protein activation family)